MFSGGVGSWAAAKRVAERHGTENLTLLFTDTLIEDEDLYRFLHEAAANVGVPVTTIADGRDPWQVFRDVRYIGNTRTDPCSMHLKRNLADAWISERFAPDEVVVYVGIDWSEEHRYARLAPRKIPYRYEAPLLDPPLLGKGEMLDLLRGEGIEPPRLYGMGFAHNNCGGFCIKAGQGHFALLLEQMPERYLEHERKEQELREFLGKDVAILRDRRGGRTRPMTLKALRERLQRGDAVDRHDHGGCGCFLDGGDQETA
jgi:hypothetical protein